MDEVVLSKNKRLKRLPCQPTPHQSLVINHFVTASPQGEALGKNKIPFCKQKLQKGIKVKQLKRKNYLQEFSATSEQVAASGV